MKTSPKQTSPSPGLPGRLGPAAWLGAMRAQTPWLSRLLPVSTAGGAAGLAFHPLFGYQPLLRPVCVATLAPALAGAVQVVTRRRIPLVLSLVISAGLWVLAACAVLFPGWHGGLPSEARLSAIGNGVASGWAELLNITLPVPPRPGLLVTPFALTWLAVSAGTELVLRTRAVLASVVPALLALTIAIAWSVQGGAGSNMPEAAAFTLSAFATVLLNRSSAARTQPSSAPVPDRPWRPTGSSAAVPYRNGGGWRGLRTAATAIPLALTMTAAAMVAGPPTLAHRSAVDPRQYWPVPIARVSQVNPLDQVAGWLAQPDQDLFEVRTSTRSNWRIAVLDEFDGQQWTSSARFTPAGLGVPWPSQTRHARRVSQRLQIAGLGGALLPAADRPVSIRGLQLSVDTDTGMLLSARPLQRGMEYSVDSELVPGLPPSQLAGLAATAGPRVAVDLRVPANLPIGIYTLARKAMMTGTAASAFQEAAILERYLRQRYTNDPKAPAGYTYGDLIQFLTSHAGTSVQFAETFTLAARILGLPSRLVVGFTVSTPTGDRNTYWIRGGDVLAWSEVDFAAAGWTPFFPAPRPSHHPQFAPSAPAQGETAAQAQVRARALQVRPHQFAREVAPRHYPVNTPPILPSRLLAWVALAAAAIAVAGYAAGVWLGPPLRRRRTRGSPALRVVGAWHDLLEQLADRGDAPSAGDTNSAVVTVAARASGQDYMPAITSLAVLATRALFAPWEATEEEAARAWQYRDASQAVLRRATPLLRRVRARMIVRVRPRRNGI